MNRAQKAEGLVLIGILFTVGTLAGLTPVTHVKQWTLDNSPAGAGAWFGWANAATSELIPLVALDRATTAANDSVRLHRRINAVQTLIDRRAGTPRL